MPTTFIPCTILVITGSEGQKTEYLCVRTPHVGPFVSLNLTLSPLLLAAVFGSFGLHTTRTVDSMLNSTYYDLPRWLRSAYLPPLVNGISDLSVATCADAYLRNAISHLICTNSFEVHHFADNTTWVSKTDITRRVKSSHDIVLGHVELNAAWEERTVVTVAGEEIVDAPHLEGYALCTFGAQRRTHTGAIDPSASSRTLSASITFRIQMPLRFH
jgi:hypothetical protein